MSWQSGGHIQMLFEADAACLASAWQYKSRILLHSRFSALLYYYLNAGTAGSVSERRLEGKNSITQKRQGKFFWESPLEKNSIPSAQNKVVLKLMILIIH